MVDGGGVDINSDKSKEELLAEIEALKGVVRENRRKLDYTRKKLRAGYVMYKELLDKNEVFFEKLSGMTNSYDQLTGLPDRTLFMQYLTMAVGNSYDRTFAVILINLDRFSGINNRLGYYIGDQCIVKVTDKINSCVRSVDNVYRIGGDEFAVIVECVSTGDEAVAIAERVTRMCERTFFISNQAVNVSVSAGIVLNSGTYRKAEGVLRDAGMALLRAKEFGGNHYIVFDKKKHGVPMNQLNLENDLIGALKNNRFELYYQPIVDVGTMDFSGFEALIRWNHPGKGCILPNDFIPIAEKTQLIVHLGRWVIEEAGRQLCEWNTTISGAEPVVVNVNISSKQLYDDEFVSHIKETISQNRIAPSQLRLEITESVLLKDAELVQAKLRQLKEIGVGVVLDDFGTGYSSFSYLATLPVDTVKIDKSFFHDDGNNSDNIKIIKTIVDLAHCLDMDVVAEGVEKDQQLESLKTILCDKVQGFLISKPLTSLAAGRMILNDDSVEMCAE